MRFSYYPGCSLRGTATEYDESARSVCRALDIQLEELKDWNCCGASSAHSTDGLLSIALPVRNLSMADEKGMDVVVPCSACFQRLKVAEKWLAENPMAEFGYHGKAKTRHLLDILSKEEVTQRVKEKVTRPLSGLRVACYYGCLVVRPPDVTGASSADDPQGMDDLMKAVGAESVPWSFKTDCCGGNLVLTRPDVADRLVKRLLDMALEAGADCLVTCCPMCQTALDTRQDSLSRQNGKKYHIPVFYFTELLGLAMGLPGVAVWLKRHLTDVGEYLSAKSLAMKVLR